MAEIFHPKIGFETSHFAERSLFQRKQRNSINPCTGTKRRRLSWHAAKRLIRIRRSDSAFRLASLSLRFSRRSMDWRRSRCGMKTLTRSAASDEQTRPARSFLSPSRASASVGLMCGKIERCALDLLEGCPTPAPSIVALTHQRRKGAAGRLVSRMFDFCLPGAYRSERADIAANTLIFMVPPPRLERGTPRSTIWCSNQLSYGGPTRAETKSKQRRLQAR